jgi:uncharacterized protein (DUF1499 family)
MNPLAWLLGFVLPACGFSGAQGVPAPPPTDLTRIVRPASPNSALVGPPASDPAPDIAAPVLPVPPEALGEAVRRVALAQPRTFLLAEYPDQRQLHFVARSALLNFPDVVAVQVLPAEGGSTLVLYSRSLYGYSDFGVNRRRAETWLAALRVATGQPQGR